MPFHSTFECFGLVIHGYDGEEIRARIDEAATRGGRIWILTANPEILLAAKRNPAYWNVLRQTDIRAVDGFGLQLVGWFLGARPKRIRGVDLARDLISNAVERGWKIAIVGGEKGMADKAAWRLRERYPTLQMRAEQGGSLDEKGFGDDAADEAVHRLTMFAPDVVLVAFGHPKQEQWILRHIDAFPSVKVAIGVGGTIDYWAGDAREAPRFMQRLGLEWFWRLLREPRRARRILNAVFVFPFEVIRDRVYTKPRSL